MSSVELTNRRWKQQKGIEKGRLLLLLPRSRLADKSFISWNWLAQLTAGPDLAKSKITQNFAQFWTTFPNNNHQGVLKVAQIVQNRQIWSHLLEENTLQIISLNGKIVESKNKNLKKLFEMQQQKVLLNWSLN